MITIVTIIGARPQIIKAAAISRAIASHYSSRIREIIVHTGQHYDENMSGVFFEELGIPRPDYNLNVGSGSHGIQTAEMIRGIEEILLKEKPNCLLVYGDTNSTLAGAIAASKIHVPIVHVEAGLRSFNKSMPEEINRILCDHCSTLLFSPTSTGLKNLEKEGFASNNKPPYSSDNPKTIHCGDVMYDNSLHFAEVAEKKNKIAENEKFILCTIHRDNNTDVPERLQSIFRALIRIISDHQMHVYLPIHPRTAKMLEANLGEALHHIVKTEKRLHLIPPASFLDMIALEKKCSMVITDSGGVQKEAYFFQKPCIIVRPQTEWVEIVESGAAVITDADENKIIAAAQQFIQNPPQQFPPVFGDGKAAEFICNEILNCFDHA